ncbi:MAG TPA: hypothetical protein VEW46_25165 [Pyrinomonadaceae bacterium]|nr:hypothetical protein [Pyrinomonadaceae bacterium]
MRLKLLAIVVTALSCCGLVLDDLSLANHQPPQGRQTLSVSRSAMLRRLRHTDGRLITNVYDGFELYYTTRSQTRSASATPEKTKGLTTSPEGVTVNENTTTAVVLTSDKALEITSYFTFNENIKLLIIQRTFRNVSTKPVTLRAVRQYVDPKLSREPPVSRNGTPILPSPLLAGLSSGSDECHMVDSKCRRPPPPCPPYCDSSFSTNSPFRARLNPSPNRNTLSWFNQIKLNPKHDKRAAGAAYIVTHVFLK